MGEIKERLIKRTEAAIQEKEIAIKKTAEEIKELEADIKVEEKLLEEMQAEFVKGGPDEELEEKISRQKAQVSALKDIMIWQENILKNLKIDRDLFNYKKAILSRGSWSF